MRLRMLEIGRIYRSAVEMGNNEPYPTAVEQFSQQYMAVQHVICELRIPTLQCYDWSVYLSMLYIQRPIVVLLKHIALLQLVFRISHCVYREEKRF